MRYCEIKQLLAAGHLQMDPREKEKISYSRYII